MRRRWSPCVRTPPGSRRGPSPCSRASTGRIAGRRADAASRRRWSSYLAAVDAEWLLWVSAPVAFAPGALAAFAAGCVLPGALLVYADSDEADRSGRRHAPRFRSAWDVWQVLEANLAGPVLALHRTLAPWIEGRRRAGEAGPWSALLRASAALPPASVVHVPQVLVQRAHAARRHEVDERRAVAEPLREAAAHRGLALEASARTTPWVRYARVGDGVRWSSPRVTARHCWSVA